MMQSMLTPRVTIARRLRSKIITHAATPADRAIAKSRLLGLIEPLQVGAIATIDDMSRVESAIIACERINPTRDPLASVEVNGKWRLVYTTSRSILGLDKPEFLRPKGPIYQFIDAEKKKAKNQESTPIIGGSVIATLFPENTRKTAVKFDYFFIGNIIPIKAPASAMGELEVTYVDDEMRISRGNRGNVFVLLQEDASARL